MFTEKQMEKMHDTQHALKIFEAALDLSAVALRSVSSNQVGAEYHIALEGFFENLTLFAENIYTTFCKEYKDTLIFTDYDNLFCLYSGNIIIRGDVKDTLSEIIKRLQAGGNHCSAPHDTQNSLLFPYFIGLHGLCALLQDLKSATFICALSLQKHHAHQNNQKSKRKGRRKRKTDQ